jgi:RNA polymerase sigma-70 factor (ECF subfamily)
VTSRGWRHHSSGEDGVVPRLRRHGLPRIHEDVVDQLRAILAADAIQYSDGGGNATVARTPIYGADKIARIYAKPGARSATWLIS